MKLDDVKLSLYKYKVKSLVISYGKGKKAKKHEVETSLISKIEIIENYDNEIFPFFTITLTLPMNIYRAISSTANKNTLKAVLQLQHAKFNEAVHLSSTKNPSFRDVIKDTFHVIVAATDIEMTSAEQKEVEKSENKYGQLASIVLSLYKKSYFDNYQTIVNANIQSCTLMDAMVLVFNRAGLKKMLVSPPQNGKSYKEFIIPPLQAHKLIARFCDTFAFHAKGTVIYFGIDRGYVIDKKPKCTAYETNEIKNTYISVFTKSKGMIESGGAYENKEKKYYLVNAVEAGADDATNIAKKTIGGKIINVDQRGKLVKTGSGKTTNVTVNKEGKTNAKAINRAIKESGNGVTCQLLDIDLNMIKPNKQFIISAEGSEYKKYNGKYRLVAATHTLTPEGNYLSMFSMIQLSGQ